MAVSSLMKPPNKLSPHSGGTAVHSSVPLHEEARGNPCRIDETNRQRAPCVPRGTLKPVDGKWLLTRWLRRNELHRNGGNARVGQDGLHEFGFFRMIESEIIGAADADHRTCTTRTKMISHTMNS